MRATTSALSPLVLAALLPAQDPAQKLELKVLYAGVPGHERTDDWREFLQARTAGFSVIATEELTREKAADFDVVVVDCPDPLPRDAKGEYLPSRMPSAPGIGVDFGKSTIFVGGTAILPDRLDLKLEWL